MKRIFKILLWTVLSITLLLGLLLAGFIYKIRNGFPVTYETDVPVLEFPEGKRAVLLFTKSTGYRHAESIDAGSVAFDSMARANDWFLYHTEEGGVFNSKQLSRFDVVIFNNSTGRVLNDDQQQALEQWVEGGGTLIGIHGAGDDSHHWDWYTENLLGSTFSHHSLSPQFQVADVNLHTDADSTLVAGLPEKWSYEEEWYVFLSNPQERGFRMLYSIDGTTINPSGNILFFKGKEFGMGKLHPVAWYNTVGAGKTFYTSIGHSGKAWAEIPFVRMIENAVKGW